MGAVEPQRGCDGGGSGDIFGACVAAIAGSLKLDSSHRGLAVGRGFQSGWRSRVGAVEPRRGCDGGGSGDIFGACVAAIAASLKLDSSYRGLALGRGFQSGWRSRVGAVEPWRDCDGGGSGDIFGACVAAIAASLKLDSSYRGLVVGRGFQSGWRSRVGAVEPWRGCDGGGSGDIFGACVAAIAASLGLDSSYRGLAVGRSRTLPGLTPQSMAITPPPRPASFLRA